VWDNLPEKTKLELISWAIAASVRMDVPDRTQTLLGWAASPALQSGGTDNWMAEQLALGGTNLVLAVRRRERLESSFLSTEAQQLRLTARPIPLWVTIAFALF